MGTYDAQHAEQQTEDPDEEGVAQLGRLCLSLPEPKEETR
jgi:hypothetical protein